MKRILLILGFLLMLVSPSRAAFVNHYCSPTGTATWAASTQSSQPTSFTTVMTAATAGDHVWLKAGSYTISAALSATLNGTVSSPVILEGWQSTTATLGGDGYQGRTNGGALDLTNFAVLNCSGNLQTFGKDYWLLRNMEVTGARSGAMALISGNYCRASNCFFQNTQSNASTTGITMSTGSLGELVNCDIKCTGATVLNVCSITQNGGRIIGSRISWTGATALTSLLNLGGTRHIALGNTLFCTVAAVGMDLTQTDGFIWYNTFYNNTVAIRTANATRTERLSVGYNIFSNSTTENIQNQNSGSANQPILITGNIQYNAAGANVGLGDWDNDYNPLVIANTADPLFVSAGSDFRITYQSAGVGAGVPVYSDLGGAQRIENYPATSNVKSGILYDQANARTGAEPTPTPCPTVTPAPGSVLLIQ